MRESKREAGKEPGKISHNGLDKKSILSATKHMTDGAVTQSYRGDLKEVVTLLNSALATEMVCYLRYMRHYFTAGGLQNIPVKAEFLEHANDELLHANQIAERIIQLNGTPDFNPGTLLDRSHAQYDDSKSLQDMIKANLVAERIAIDSYRDMIETIGQTDLTTRHMLIQIMAKEEEHAEDMRDLIV